MPSHTPRSTRPAKKAERLRSRTIYDGVIRATTRSFLLALGQSDAEIERPHIGVFHTGGEMSPSNLNLADQALHAKTGIVTAIASDYDGYDEVYARQVRAHGRPGDVLLALSTSGRSRNLLRAAAAAKAGGLASWCLTGPAPNPLADACDEAVCVYPAGARALSLAATVQEAHQVALHLISMSFDAALTV